MPGAVLFRDEEFERLLLGADDVTKKLRVFTGNLFTVLPERITSILDRNEWISE